MKKYLWPCICLFTLGMMFVPVTQADEELENTALAQIIHVLDSLTPLINAAEQQQNKNAREQFNYRQLRSDLQKIRIGIKEKLTDTPIQPRAVTPISGDYLTMMNKQR